MVNVRFEGIGLKQEPDAEDRRCWQTWCHSSKR